MNSPLAQPGVVNPAPAQLRPKILSVCVHPPQMPGSGGAVRAYHFANALADYGDLTLVCLGGPSAQDPVDPRIAAKCQRVIRPDGEPAQPPPTSRLGHWSRTLKAILFPWQDNWSAFTSFCLQYCPTDSQRAGHSTRLLRTVFRNEFRLLSRFVDLPPVSIQMYGESWKRVWPQLADLVGRESFSLIFFENSIYFPFADRVQRLCADADGRSKTEVPIVCNAANIEYVLHQRLAKYVDDAWQSEWDHAQVRFIKALEQEAFRQCDLVITCSTDDQQLATQLAGETRHCVIGNGVDLDYFQPVDGPASDPPTLLFTGSFRYAPNQDGLRYFVDAVFPLISKARPDCRLLFAGFDAQDLYDELNISDPRISCISSPDDIRPCFSGVSVFVVPLRIGGGTRLKILEAMSMEKAIVSTRIGAEGIPAEDGRHLLLADQPQEFADAVLKLINDPVKRQEMVNDASEWVKQHYGWKQLCSRAIDQIDDLIAD